jgi:hypothetical protein
MKSPGSLIVLMLVLTIPATNACAAFSQNFEVDTSGWFTFAGSGTVNQEADGYVSPVPYASGITSASPTHHARLRRGDCGIDPTGGGGPTVECQGPFTRWGGYNSVWMGGYTTQVDVYLEVAYAKANPDSYPGNLACLTANSSDTSCKGTRFDFSSAINDSGGNFLQDYVFNVGTGDPAQPNPCASGGFVVAASTNAFRSGASPYDLGHDPFCVANSGWYTFKHTFTDVGGFLQVLMEIFPAGSSVPLHQWTITPGHAISELGCNRYGWFAEQEIWDLPIDNSRMVGCGAPLPPDHFSCYEILPTPFTSVPNVSLVDQFGSSTTTTVKRPHYLCAPADKKGEDPSAPSHPDHLTAYLLHGSPVKKLNQTVKNQFGTIVLDVVKPSQLLVPTAKSLAAPAPPAPIISAVDHFQCYKVKRSKGSSKFNKITGIPIEDQFGTGTIDLLKVTDLCAPVDKNGENPGAENHKFKLLCYMSRGNAPFATKQVWLDDQFGPLNGVSLSHRPRFCVPSSPSGAFVEDSR